MSTIPKHIIEVEKQKKIYFASDFHLGSPNFEESRKREKKIVDWLDFISADVQELFLLGDIFDFWYEFGKVIPKGYVRLFGKLAQLSDNGVKIHYFKGNHDMWLRDYFQEELGVLVWHDSLELTINKKKFHISHGDGIGPGDWQYRFLKSCFQSKTLQRIFSLFHPDLSLAIAYKWSRHSRKGNSKKDEKFYGMNERQIVFSKELLEKEHFDYFIYGHRHLCLDIALTEDSRYLNSGDWIKYNSYIQFDGEELTLNYFQPKS